MILVFALAAAVCLQAFVYANQLSSRGEKENIAATHAQEVIEMCKTCDGDWQKVVWEMPGQMEGNTLEIPFEQDHMIVKVEKTDVNEYLTNAKVVVYDNEKKEIYHVSTAWQRGGTS